MTVLAWDFRALAVVEHGSASWWALVIGLTLLVVNGLFTATEISLLAVRSGRIERRAEAGDTRAKWAQRALSDLPTSFSATQIGVTLSSLGLGAVAEPALAAGIVGMLSRVGLPDAAARSVSITIALLLVIFLHMVVGDMAPKNLAIAQPDRVILVLARPFGVFVAVMRPVIVVLNIASRAVLALVRTKPVEGHQLVHTPDELSLALTAAAEQGTIERQDAEVLGAALRLGSLTAQSAMTPRNDLAAVHVDADIATVLDAARDSGHTRLLVHEGDLDRILGMVHVKDVIVASDHQTSTLRQMLRGLPVVFESRQLDELLASMRRQGHHAAVVVDEFGSTVGLVTLEDIVEELVGDIVDEFDDERRVMVADRRWIVPGTMRRDELQRRCGLALEGANDTVSGWMVEQLGRLPQRGDIVQIDDWTLRVRTVDGLRAGSVEVAAPGSSPVG